MTHDEYIAEGKGLRKVSPTIGGGDAARVATQLACRGMASRKG